MTLNQAEREIALLRFQTELVSERVRLKLSTKQTAKLLQISPPTYYRYETGHPSLRKWEMTGILETLKEVPTP
jgi:hypothetical protein